MPAAIFARGPNALTAAGAAMFPSSLAVVVTGVLLMALALIWFGWAWRRRQFADVRAQSLVVFDDDDLCLERPWESSAQRTERMRQHGAPLIPHPGEWGGAE